MSFKKRVGFVVLCGVAVIIACSFFLRQIYVIPVIMYHSVQPQSVPGNRLVVSTGTFERQMRFLKNNHYRVVPLETVVQYLRENKRAPYKTIAITFDDGYKDNYTQAFPILQKYGLPATIFIIINEVGRGQGDRVSWDDLKVMQASGVFTVGSHAITPVPLVEMNPDQARQEITESKKILEERLGVAVKLFSYTEGFFNPGIRQMVINAGYDGAVATNPGKHQPYPGNDFFAIKRLRISENARNLFVFAVETSGFYTFMKESKRKHGKK